jgi:hypothetical protein
MIPELRGGHQQRTTTNNNEDADLRSLAVSRTFSCGPPARILQSSSIQSRSATFISSEIKNSERCGSSVCPSTRITHHTVSKTACPCRTMNQKMSIHCIIRLLLHLIQLSPRTLASVEMILCG